MPLQQIQQRGSIAGIAFGSRWTERLPVLSGRLRVYRKQYQVRIFGQQADQRSPRLFQTDGNRPAAEALVQLHRPDLYGLRRVLHFPLFVPTGSRRCQPPEMLPVGPVDGNAAQSGSADFSFIKSGISISFQRGRAWLPRKAYSGVWRPDDI